MRQKETDRQKKRQADSEKLEQTNIRRARQTEKKTDGKTWTKTDRQAKRKTGRHEQRQGYRHFDRKKQIKIDRQMNTHTDRQTHSHTHTHRHLHVCIKTPGTHGTLENGTFWKNVWASSLSAAVKAVCAHAFHEHVHVPAEIQKRGISTQTTEPHTWGTWGVYYASACLEQSLRECVNAQRAGLFSQRKSPFSSTAQSSGWASVPSRTLYSTGDRKDKWGARFSLQHQTAEEIKTCGSHFLEGGDQKNTTSLGHLPVRESGGCLLVCGICWGSRTEGLPTELSTAFQPAPSPASVSCGGRGQMVKPARTQRMEGWSHTKLLWVLKVCCSDVFTMKLQPPHFISNGNNFKL